MLTDYRQKCGFVVKQRWKTKMSRSSSLVFRPEDPVQNTTMPAIIKVFIVCLKEMFGKSVPYGEPYWVLWRFFFHLAVSVQNLWLQK